MVDKRPIGIFDSGIGGLTVLKKLQCALPNEHFVYFADTAHLPYGEKTPEQIIGYARQTLTWMQDEIGAKLIVAACHTSSAIALNIVSSEYSVPIIGTIYPMVDAILKNPRYSRIGIIATPASVSSRMHEAILLTSGFHGEVHSISCPRFVPLIEDGHIFGQELLRNTIEYLSAFNKNNLNTLIYGCTHYLWIENIIHQTLPKTMQYIDPAEHVAFKVTQELYNKKIVNTLEKKEILDFYCSNNPEKFATQIRLLMKIADPKVTLTPFTSPIPLQKQAVNE